MRKTRREHLMTLGAGLFLWPMRQALAEDAASFGPYAGSYRFVGGQREIDKFYAAIEEVCEEMNFVFRTFARPKLREALAPQRRCTFSFSGARVKLVRSSIPVLEGPMDGKPFTWVDTKGTSTNLRVWPAGESSIAMHFDQEESQSRFEWRFGEEGRMRLHAKVNHVQLPSTLRYRFSYRR